MTILYLAPTTDVVLAHIAEQVHAARRERPLAPLTCLLPSGDAIRQLRRVLGDVIGVRFLQFHNLSAAVLSESGSATHEMSDLATRRVVRGILRQLGEARQLTTFAAMLDKPGFMDVLVEWLREMKTQGIPPADVTNHAAQSGKPRDLQLATLYERYQVALRQGDCADADGLLWLAAEALERDAALLASAGDLIVAGFDQFSPVQLRMVAALARRLPLTVYLLWDETRAPTSLALGRLAPTRDALRSALAPREVALPIADACGPALAHVRRFLFQPGASPVSDDMRCVEAIAAPSPEAEVRHALRRIKQLLLDGKRAEQIALLAPQPGTYQNVVGAISREYGVPVACEATLGENPCVAALLNLLALAPAFPWRQTFDALRSPYVRQPWLNAEQIARLDALTRQRPVIAGLDQWRHALTPTAARAAAETAIEDEDRAEPLLIDQLEPEEVAALCAGLDAFFQHLTPQPDLTDAGYVAWIQDALLGLSHEAEPDEEGEPAAALSLNMAAAASEGEWAERDVRALRTLLQALLTWLDSVALAGDLGFASHEADQSTREGYRADLLEWLPSVPIQPDRKLAAVRFGPLKMNRAVTVDHLFVLGLGEGEFPHQPPPDPFYTAAERAAHPLPLVRLGAAEDASLWWQVLCNCQCSLMLLRSRYDKSGAEWLPSPYWTAVTGLIEGLEERIAKPLLSARPTVADAACSSELIEALALRGDGLAPESMAGPWRSLLAAQRVAAARDGWAAPAGYEGVMRDAQVLDHLARRYGPGRSWSISRLNRYGVCPYAFWAQQALELEALADPAEGFDAMQRGSLVHKILEQLFARLAAAGLAPAPDAADEIAGILDEVCDVVLPRAAEQYGFRPGPLWEHEQAELRAELAAYLAWECEAKQAGAFRPFRQELKFGLGPGSAAKVPIPGIEGAEITLRGVIDRIDSDGAGHLRVIDYKTGSTPYSAKDIEFGRALQSALYAWVVEAIFPEAGVVVETCYRHTGSRKESGRIEGGPAQENGAVLGAAVRAVQMAEYAVGGWFAPAPSRGSAARACDETCDYLGLCRVTRHGVRKARAEMPLFPDGESA